MMEVRGRRTMIQGTPLRFSLNEEEGESEYCSCSERNILIAVEMFGGFEAFFMNNSRNISALGSPRLGNAKRNILSNQSLIIRPSILSDRFFFPVCVTHQARKLFQGVFH